MARIMYSSPLPRLMSPKVQMHLSAGEPQSRLVVRVALKWDRRHAVRNDLHGRIRNAIDVGQQPRGNVGHHDDALALGREFRTRRRGSGSGSVSSV